MGGLRCNHQVPRNFSYTAGPASSPRTVQHTDRSRNGAHMPPIAHHELKFVRAVDCGAKTMAALSSISFWSPTSIITMALISEFGD